MRQVQIYFGHYKSVKKQYRCYSVWFCAFWYYTNNVNTHKNVYKANSNDNNCDKMRKSPESEVIPYPLRRHQNALRHQREYGSPESTTDTEMSQNSSKACTAVLSLFFDIVYHKNVYKKVIK